MSTMNAGPWPITDPEVAAVLADLEAREAREATVLAGLGPEELAARRDEFLLPVGRSAGALLHLLACDAGAKSALELGTSYGYSTIWLADAMRATGGKLVSLDRVADKQAEARTALARAGLAAQVELCAADAVEYLAATQKTFDFVLLDIWKDLYVACFDALLPRLSEGAILVADNMLQPESARFAMARYRAHVRRVPELDTVLLPVGNGLAISRFKAK